MIDSRQDRAAFGPVPRAWLVPVLSLLSGATVALSLLACSDDGGTEPDPEPAVPAFPADFRGSFSQVRDCRETAEHGIGRYIDVWADPAAAQAYLDGASSFEVGTVLVKPIYLDETCDPASIVSYVVMVKAEPGFAPDTHDWLWQSVDADRRVTEEGDLAECTGCHGACVTRDYACTDE